jgi:hypothetical protein
VVLAQRPRRSGCRLRVRSARRAQLYVHGIEAQNAGLVESRAERERAAIRLVAERASTFVAVAAMAGIVAAAAAAVGSAALSSGAPASSR